MALRGDENDCIGPGSLKGTTGTGETNAIVPKSALRVVPVRFRDACAFIETHHRHHQPPRGMLFAIGVASGGTLHAVAVTGRPVARLFDNGQTAEVTRVASDGTPNACSLLYAACWRAAKALGYTRLITYTQAGEPGASLRAAGWRVVAERPPHAGWNRASRPRDAAEPVQRTLWEAA